MKLSNHIKGLYYILLIFLALSILGCGATYNAKTPPVNNNILIKNVTIVDVENRLFKENQTIYIKKDRITYIGDRSTAPKNLENASRVIDGHNLIALPGFVNTHTHLWQHLTKSLDATAVLQSWIRSIYPYAHYIDNKELERITYIAAKQAQLSGITTVSDFTSVNFRYGSLESTFRGLHKANMGGLVTWWHPAVFLPNKIRVDHFHKTLKRSRNYGLDLSMGFGPLSFMPLPAVYDGIRLGSSNTILLSEHTMENLGEARSFQNRIKEYFETYGNLLDPEDSLILKNIVEIKKIDSRDLFISAKRALSSLDSTAQEVKVPSMFPLLEHLGALQNFLSIHSVWLNQEDFELLKRSDATISHNPESNMYLASGIAPLLQYKNNKIPITIGTDGAASNDRIDMFTAMSYALNLLKINHLDPKKTKSIDSWEILRAATINGAYAMGLENDLGSITVGKEADIVLLSKERLSISPLHPKNNVALLINGAGIRDIKAVISNGQLVVDNYSLVNDAEEKLANELNQIFNTVNSRKDKGRNINNQYDAESSIIDYFSIRKQDSANLIISNSSRIEKRIRIMISKGPFGGNSTGALSKETLRRFPLNDNLENYNKEFVLKPNNQIIINKKRNQNIFSIILSDGTKEYYTGGRGQISISTPQN